jgi:hypothetical protein
VVALVTIWLIWPAAWQRPIGTAIEALTFSAELGSVPHGPGNFFLGQPIEDPGPAFYPVALALRLGPGTTIGVLLLFTFGTRPEWRRSAWTLLGFVLLFLVLLTVAAKKVDRYLLPTLPALGILAAVGWYEAGDWLLGWWYRRRRYRRGDPAPQSSPRCDGEGERTGYRPVGDGEGVPAFEALPPGTVCLLPADYARHSSFAARPSPLATRFSLLVVAALAFAVQVWPLVTAGRYPLSAYNPLFGGVRMAERAIPVGWGDGLDVAGDLIRQLAPGRPVVTSIWSPLRVNFGAHAPGPVVSHLQIANADFYVDYVHSRQRRLTPRQLLSRTPDAVVTIGGVDYARIYRLR